MEPLDQSQFLKELSQIQKFGSHVNVLNFYGICQTPDWLYLLFEHTPFTLKKKLVEARLPPNVNRLTSFSEAYILQLMSSICSALEYLTLREVGHPFKNTSVAMTKSLSLLVCSPKTVLIQCSHDD